MLNVFAMHMLWCGYIQQGKTNRQDEIIMLSKRWLCAA